jgi:hypothetical protein
MSRLARAVVASSALVLGRNVSFRWLAPGAAALVLFAAPARAEDDQELNAREAFAAGRYQEALDGYAKLFARTLHPTYLRNVGRCHQMLGNPDKAINSFREYLRRAPELPAGQRAEVEGFITEMEALKKRQASDAASREREHEARPAAARADGGGGRAVEGETIVKPAVAGGGDAAGPTLSHGGQIGVVLRSDAALLPERGLVVVPGLSFGIGDRLEIAAGGLVGHFKGGWIGARILLASGALKPLVSLDVPLFFVDGKAMPGLQPGAGVEWDPSRHFGLFAAVTAPIFPGADADLQRFWLVPSLGIQGRL